MSNAWGIVLILLLLSYGLVAVPKQFWQSANYHERMNYLEWMTQDINYTLEEKELDLLEYAEVIVMT